MNRPSQGNRQPNTSARLLGLGAFFAVICLVFVVVLAVIQYQGSKNMPEDDGLTVRKHTVAGQRGKIYDTNGKLIVGNTGTYSLIYEYDAMPDTYKEINASLLSLVSAINETGNGDRRSKDYFVLEGVYPNVRFSLSLSDKSSEEWKGFADFLEYSGYKEDIDAETFCEYFIDRYRLYDYSDRQIHELIRLWYDMNRIGFSSYTYYTLAENITGELITRVEEERTEGATVLTCYTRSYEFPGYATHILGHVGKITAETAEHYTSLGYSLDATVGVSGCEEEFESYLHSQNGILVQKYDENGVLVKEYYEVKPITGTDIFLTIDMDLQIAAEDGLRAQADAIRESTATATAGQANPSGAVVAQDPHTGALRAIASYPTYDLTRLREQSYVDAMNRADANNPWLNRALNSVYAPGSTYKVGVALAALEAGNIDSNQTFTCNKVFHIDGKECLGNHGAINVTEAIRVSCNIFFYSIGELFGLEDSVETTTALGLGAATGIELDEKTGNVAGTDTVTEKIMGAIGQSTHEYTPLQLSVYAATVFNGGTRYGAHLLNAEKTDGRASEATVLETVSFGDSTHAILLDAMEQVVSSSASLRGYFGNLPDDVTVGGKTGTAQKDNQAYDNALFVGFSTSAERGDLVVSCVIEEGVAGGNAAVPVSYVMEAFYGVQGE